MLQRNAEASPRPRARITGVVYLLYFLTAILGELFLKGLVVDGNAAATANNILAHQPLFRLGIATGLIATACYVLVTALFYDLFEPVNRRLSLLAAFFSLVECAILAFASLFRLAPLVVLGGGKYLSGFNVEQLRALGFLSLELYGHSVNICFVFFGVYCLLIGYLISGRPSCLEFWACRWHLPAWVGSPFCSRRWQTICPPTFWCSASWRNWR
jgi:hypothetical protein